MGPLCGAAGSCVRARRPLTNATLSLSTFVDSGRRSTLSRRLVARLMEPVATKQIPPAYLHDVKTEALFRPDGCQSRDQHSGWRGRSAAD